MHSRFDRFLPVTGIIAGLLILATWLVPTGPDSPDSPKLTAYFADHQNALMISAFVGALACVAVLFFATAIRSALRSGEAGESSYSSVAYAGAVLVAMSGTTNNLIQLAVVDAAHHGHADSARTISYLGEFGWLPWVVASSAMLLGVGLGGLRTSVIPKWLSIVSVILGVLCLLGPTGVAVFFAQPVWYIATGAVLVRRMSASRSSAPASRPIPAGV